MSNNDPAVSSHKSRRRFAPLVWISGGAAALLLILGVNGTLSGWTQAIISNGNNDVASAAAVALSEAGGTGTDGSTCDTAGQVDNTATCATVNKYGGVAGGGAETTASGITPLAPGDQRSATVTLTNDGTGKGNLVLDADACSNSVNDSAGGDTTATYDICTQITVSVTCTGDSAVGPTAAVALSDFDGAVIGDLDPTQSATCTFHVKLPASTPSGYSNQLASQALTWTLTAV